MPEPQVLIDFYDDEDGYYWHHRVLLARGAGPGQWIVGTPDGDVQATLLTDHRVIPLVAGGPFPAAQQGQIYAFGPDTPEAMLETMRGQARVLAGILGPVVADAPAAPPRPLWLLSDPAAENFGEEVPEGTVGDERHFVERGGVALVLVDNVWTTAQSVPAGGVDAWRVAKAAGPGRDPRLLPDRRNSRGHRECPFEAAVDMMRSTAAPPGWPFGGPPVAREYLDGLVAAGFTPTLYSESWLRTSGVRGGSAAAREHKGILEAVRLGIGFDQIDLPATALGEFLLRRLVQLETAVRRAPLSPDFSGLEHMLVQAVDASGAVAAPEFSKWSSGVMRDEAQVLKQSRLWREEQSSLARASGKSKGKGKKKGDGEADAHKEG